MTSWERLMWRFRLQRMRLWSVLGAFLFGALLPWAFVNAWGLGATLGLLVVLLLNGWRYTLSQRPVMHTILRNGRHLYAHPDEDLAIAKAYYETVKVELRDWEFKAHWTVAKLPKWYGRRPSRARKEST